MQINKDTDFVKALGRIPSGLFVVTAEHQGKRAAFLGSFVQQVSFDPLIIAIACHPDRYPYQIIKGSGRFGISIIPEGDKILMKTFTKGHGPDEDPFQGMDVEEIDGVPLLKNSLGAAVCEVVSEAKPGDHVVFFGKPINGTFYQPEAKPWVHVRKHALSY